MIKPEWGIKRHCQACGVNFYDLKRSPIVCPKCSEVFDPEARTWQPLPAMVHARSRHAAVAVAGGLVVVGGIVDSATPNELFDEASGRWFELPHPMAEPRNDAGVVSLPVSALSAPAGAAAPAQ